MKKIRIKKKDLKKMIGDLEKAYDIFTRFGDNLWDTMEENDQNVFGNGEKIILTTVNKLKSLRCTDKEIN